MAGELFCCHTAQHSIPKRGESLHTPHFPVLTSSVRRAVDIIDLPYAQSAVSPTGCMALGVGVGGEGGGAETLTIY